MNEAWEACEAPQILGWMSPSLIRALNARGVIPVVKRGCSRAGIFLFRQEGENVFDLAKDACLLIGAFSGLKARVLGRYRGHRECIHFLFQEDMYLRATYWDYGDGLVLQSMGNTAHCPRCLKSGPYEDRRSSQKKETIPLRWPLPRAEKQREVETNDGMV